jgi:hypothetical protein
MPQSTSAGAHAPASPPFRQTAPPPLWLWLILPLATAVVLAVLGTMAPEFYGKYIEPEIGVLETVHVLEGVAGTVLAASLLSRPEVRRARWLTAWVVLALIGCIYVAGEEASWGQHLFAWTTPSEWQAINDQNETNLHNASSWLDQKPRLLLELGVIVGGIIFPLAQRGGRWPQHGRIAYIVPPLTCLPAAAMAESVRLNEAGAWLLDTPRGLYYRGSEVQELFFYFFVILYLMALAKRVRTIAPPD